jgi:hypothetical protein
MCKNTVLFAISRPESTTYNVNRHSTFQDTGGRVHLHTEHIAGTFQNKSGKRKQPQ